MEYILFAIFLAACFGAGATGAVFEPGEWYHNLKKPGWTPPNWAFPIMWTTIYVLIAFAGARVALLSDNGYAMAFWAAQIALNALWTPIFFGVRRIKSALIVMVFLWLSVLGCVITHWQVDFLAGVAMVPYLVWVTIAGALNLSVVRLNPDAKPLDLSKL